MAKSSIVGDVINFRGFVCGPATEMGVAAIFAKAFEQAFAKALEQTLQAKAEQMFKHAFENGSTLSKKLEQKIDEGFQRFVDEGIRWEKRKPGFKK